MTDGNRAFCMGNALVVGIPHRIGKGNLRAGEERVNAMKASDFNRIVEQIADVAEDLAVVAEEEGSQTTFELTEELFELVGELKSFSA